MGSYGDNHFFLRRDSTIPQLLNLANVPWEGQWRIA